MIIKDVILTHAQIVSAKTFVGLLYQHEPGCVHSLAGVKQRSYDYAYQLRFLVDEECLAKRQFPAPDYELGADFVIEDEDD